MTPAQPSAEQIFSEALARPAGAERVAYLNAACGSNPDLRKRVKQLLQAHRDAQSFLESPAINPVPTIDQQPPERPGTVVGPYKLLQQIGEGGMGVVYMAEQSAPISRRVALKIIKPGMDTRQVIARFEAERQALAMMDHMNIARVLDAGTTGSGRPFFVMELVHGVSITKYCDERHLTPRERLELFVPVCQAIQHAHQKGIIHRDIKPSNVMVTLCDGRPIPKVIDFGVAKATAQKLTEKTLFTQYGTLVGTLEYMSPEQAEISALGVDTRSDIYSLGVLLYELLTGSTPLTQKRLKDAAYAEILRLIKEEEPPKPSTRIYGSGAALASISAQRQTEPLKLSKLMRGELDWIVMKTLEKDRNRRYETASGFAADVQRYLNDEPVQACPPSKLYRFGKFARKNRVALTTAAVVALALVIGTGVSTWQAIRATNAQTLARAKETQARRAAAAERTAKQAETVQRKRAEASEQQALAAAAAERTARQAESVQRERAEKGEQHARANLKLARDTVDQMLVRVAGRLANVPHMEQVPRELTADALKFYEAVLQEDNSDPQVRSEQANAFLEYGDMQMLLGEGRVAEQAFNQAIKIYQELANSAPATAKYQSNLVYSYDRLGRVLSLHTTRLGEAEQAFRQALTICRKLETDFPNKYRLGVDLQVMQLVHVLTTKGQLVEAETMIREALARRLEDPNALSGEPLVNTYQALGSVLIDAGRFAEAEQTLRQALTLQEKRLARAPNDPVARGNLADNYTNLSIALQRSGQAAESEKAVRASLAIAEKLADDFPSVPYRQARLALVHGNLSVTLFNSGQFADAEKAIRSSLTILEKLAADFPTKPSYRNQLASNLHNLGELRLRTDRQSALPKQALTSAVLKTERLLEAQSAFLRAIEINEKLTKETPDNPEYARDLAGNFGQLGLLLLEFGELDEAEKLIRRSLAGAEKLAKDFPDVKEHQAGLGYAYGRLGLLQYRRADWKTADASLQRAFDQVNDGQDYGDSQFFLAMTHWQLGNKEQASKSYAQAVEWTSKHYPQDPRLARFRAEAAKLLGVKDEPKPEKLPP